MKFKVLVLILFITCLGGRSSIAQESSLEFFEVITGDSVMLFFNEHYKFSEKKCCDFIRRTRIDSEGYFNGFFEDHKLNVNEKLGQGRYEHGVKNGLFEQYFPNGKLKSKGRYINGFPVGDWYYYYDNEALEKIVRVTETDTLLIEFAEKNGDKKIINGFGNFKGYVSGASIETNEVLAEGNIIEGKPDGKWTSSMGDQTYCKEEFEKGKFIEGNFPAVSKSKEKAYTHRSFLKTFFSGTYFNTLEEFKVEKCRDKIVMKERIEFSGMEKFGAEVKIKINDLIKKDFASSNLNSESVFDSKFSIQFETNEKGKAQNFSLVTGMLTQLEGAITTSINRYMTFPPNEKKYYLHINFHFPGGGGCHYNFAFSKENYFNE